MDIEFQSGVLEHTDGPRYIEFQQQIDVAVRMGLTPRHRTENRSMGHAKLAQICLVSTKDFERILKGHSHGSPRVYQTLGIRPALLENSRPNDYLICERYRT